MNRELCEKCRRYESDPDKRGGIWMCAKHIYLEHSSVIPGHSFYIRNLFHYMTSEAQVPEWCERPLEKTILNPDEKTDIAPDSNVQYDGNDLAVWHRRDKEQKAW